MKREEAKNLIFEQQEPLDPDEFEFAITVHKANYIIDKIFADFKIELEDAKAQGFREAIKEMGKVKGL